MPRSQRGRGRPGVWSCVVSGDGTRALRETGRKTEDADSQRKGVRTNPDGEGRSGAALDRRREDNTIDEATAGKGLEQTARPLHARPSYGSTRAAGGAMSNGGWRQGRQSLSGRPRSRCRNKGG